MKSECVLEMSLGPLLRTERGLDGQIRALIHVLSEKNATKVLLWQIEILRCGLGLSRGKMQLFKIDQAGL